MAENENAFWEWVDENFNYTDAQIQLLKEGLTEGNRSALSVLRKNFEEISGFGERTATLSSKALGAFYKWAETKYSPSEIKIIRQDPSLYLQYYIKNIQGTQFDVGFEPDVDRPPEEFGLSTNDWRLLREIGGRGE